MAVRVDQNLERMRDVARAGRRRRRRRRARRRRRDRRHERLADRAVLRPAAPRGARSRPTSASSCRCCACCPSSSASAISRFGSIKLAPDHDVIASNPRRTTSCCAMADQVIDRYRDALRAWATLDLAVAAELATPARSMDVFYERLLAEIMRLDGPDARPRRDHDLRRRPGARAHRRPRHDHRRPPALPAHGRPRPPRRRGPLSDLERALGALRGVRR